MGYLMYLWAVCKMGMPPFLQTSSGQMPNVFAISTNVDKRSFLFHPMQIKHLHFNSYLLNSISYAEGAPLGHPAKRCCLMNLFPMEQLSNLSVAVTLGCSTGLTLTHAFIIIHH
jgi:hypothetical protein